MKSCGGEAFFVRCALPRAFRCPAGADRRLAGRGERRRVLAFPGDPAAFESGLKEDRMADSHEKLAILKSSLSALGSAAIAFSGGVDSSFLLRVAHDVLGEKAVAVTVISCFVPRREREEARDFCTRNGIRQLELAVDVLALPGLAQNPADRCYHCKKVLFTRIIGLAGDRGLSCVCEGSNMDDTADYRPGLKAIAELGVRSPLREAGLYKAEIRELSRELGLSGWNKPSFACLASRIPYGEPLTKERLSMVEQAEQLLLDRGFSQFRVRMHGGSLARIEVPSAELDRLFADRDFLVQTFRELGFTYVTMDLQGYRTGAMNETLGKEAD